VPPWIKRSSITRPYADGDPARTRHTMFHQLSNVVVPINGDTATAKRRGGRPAVLLPRPVLLRASPSS